MISSIKMLFRLWGQSAKMDLLWFLRDTRYCALYIFTDTVTALASASAALLVGARFGGIGGMTSDEILFMSGYAVLTDGIILLLLGGGNVAYISRIIGRGQLDHMLIQPVPLWMQMLTSGFIPFSGSSKLLCGLVLTAVSIGRLKLSVGPAWLAGYLCGQLSSALVILSVVFLVSCSAFYAPAAAEEISMVVHELFTSTKYYPLGGISARGIRAFCTLVPVGLAAWFPSNVLLGRAPAGLPSVLTLLAALLWSAAATLLFRKGMLHYEKYGSNRYTGFGHR